MASHSPARADPLGLFEACSTGWEWNVERMGGTPTLPSPPPRESLLKMQCSSLMKCPLRTMSCRLSASSLPTLLKNHRGQQGKQGSRAPAHPLCWLTPTCSLPGMLSYFFCCFKIPGCMYYRDMGGESGKETTSVAQLQGNPDGPQKQFRKTLEPPRADTQLSSYGGQCRRVGIGAPHSPTH